MLEDEVKTDSTDTTNDAVTQNEEYDRLDDIVQFDVKCRMTRRHANALVCALKQMEHNADMGIDTIVGIATSCDGHDMRANFEVNGFEAKSMMPNTAGLIDEDGNPRIVFDPAGEGEMPISWHRDHYANFKPDSETQANLREFLEKNGYLNDNWLKDGLSNIIPICVGSKPWEYAYSAGLTFPEGDDEEGEKKTTGYIPGFGIMETADTYWHLLKILEKKLTIAIDEWLAAGKELPKFPRTFEEMYEMCRGKMEPVSWAVVTSFHSEDESKEETCP